MSEKAVIKNKGSSMDLESKPNTSIAIDKTILQDIIGTVGQSEDLSEPTDTTNNQAAAEKTSEDDNTEQTNSKTSRELKLLLALSKEANLDTNISRKRKTIEGKFKDKEPSLKISSSDSDIKKAKVAHESRNIRYPVTAEAELELEIQDNEVKSMADNSSKSSKRKRDGLSEVNAGGATEEVAKRNRKSLSNEIVMFKVNKDMFCWRCHREGVNISCETCPRSYHQRCLKQTIHDVDHWPCPECVAILKAESTQTRSEAMKGMTLEHLCSLLKFAVNRMIQCQGSEPFLHPVSDSEFPDYKKYIIQPMDLTKIEKNIKENLYGSTQAFEADAKWLLHNSIIFNSYQSKLTSAAKNIVKICKQEMAEIENCPSCYLNANTKKATWFVEVCPKPHLLVWAKLKGFPYWPAKAMCTNSAGMVDVRFFGAHDRAWVHYKECYLFSEKDPNTFKQKRYDIEKCVEELNIYIQNLRKVYGEFKYAPYKILIEPHNELKQLQMFLPKYKANLPVKKRVSKYESKTLPQDKKDIKDPKSNSSVKENIPKTEVKESENQPSLNPEQQVKDKLEIKENIPETKTEESDLNQNTSELTTNGISQFQDDSIMEGYGTDDDTNPEIDLERRKTFIGKKSGSLSEKIEGEEEEEEEDNDTQVPSNINIDSSFLRSSVKLREVASNSAGNNKNLPRRTSDTDSIQKRQSTDELPHSPQKMSRRNSDQSVKSDSSRISNISDKINRVDISENMEITLGNDDIGCISISENISSNNSESSKSSSEHSLESKKKPVQVDIENAEFTISPSNKLKISDKLMKRLSDGGESISNSAKVKDVKKTPLEKKSPTDILIEKFKGVVEHEIIDFSQPSTSSTSSKCDENNLDNMNEISKMPITTEESNKISDAEESNPASVTITVKDIDPETTSSSNKESENAVKEIQSVDSATKIIENINEVNKETPSNIDTFGVEKEKQVREKENITTIDKNKKNKGIELKDNDTDKPGADEKAKIETDQGVSKKQKHFIQPTSSKKPESNKEVSKDTADNTTKDTPEAKNTEKSNSGSENTDSQGNREVINIIEEFRDDEETLDDIQIDKNNIFNIIHSSLNAAKSKEDSNKESTAVENSNSSSKKRKLYSDENASSQAKLVKLVPIESILRKNNNNDKGSTDSPLLQKSLQGKKMIRKPSSASSASSTSRQSSSQEIITEEIKSEPDTDEDFSESENLEAKRKYLSALNISEKINESDKKLKANEIRTRSKTEEKKERFRIVDNLTKTIDDVALNYSANHEGQELSLKKLDNKKNSVVTPEGEIFVKSFARLQTSKQRARKSFPVPAYLKPGSQVSVLRKEFPPSVTVTRKEVPKSSSSSCNSSIITTKVVSNTNTVTTQAQKTPETVTNAVSHLILLPPNQTINYTSSIGNPVLTMVPTIVSATSVTSTAQTIITPAVAKTKPATPNIRASQNYIPQNEGQTNDPPVSETVVLNDLLSQPISTSTEPEPIAETGENSSNSNTATVEATPDTQRDDDFTILNSLLPENVTRAVSDLLLRPPPRLKPRPPGMLSTAFDEGVPSSAGSVTAKINSVAHRLGDYFRGMLVETLEDLGKSASPEAKIASLQLEIEALKHRHNVELSEIRKNVCTILKDIQKSIVEDREKVVDETRAMCEVETIKRIELAKSKQWCANCSKEAQFYCCWNTSYCDYPCQQKHWPQHLGKCTQNIEKTSNTVNLPNRPAGQQLILRPAVPPKPGLGRIVAKPTKVYMNRNVGPPKTYKTLSTTGNHLTVIETTPGNYELVGNGPIAVTGKFLAATSNIFHSKFKTTNVMAMTSPSTSGTADQRNTQKTTTIPEPTKSATPTSTTSLPVTTVEDESD